MVFISSKTRIETTPDGPEIKVSVRLDTATKAKWVKAAKKAKRPLAQFIRDCVRAYVANGAAPLASD